MMNGFSKMVRNLVAAADSIEVTVPVMNSVGFIVTAALLADGCGVESTARVGIPSPIVPRKRWTFSSENECDCFMWTRTMCCTALLLEVKGGLF